MSSAVVVLRGGPELQGPIVKRRQVQGTESLARRVRHSFVFEVQAYADWSPAVSYMRGNPSRKLVTTGTKIKNCIKYIQACGWSLLRTIPFCIIRLSTNLRVLLSNRAVLKPFLARISTDPKSIRSTYCAQYQCNQCWPYNASQRARSLLTLLVRGATRRQEL